jgi:hypothetical protein
VYTIAPFVSFLSAIQMKQAGEPSIQRTRPPRAPAATVPDSAGNDAKFLYVMSKLKHLEETVTEEQWKAQRAERDMKVYDEQKRRRKVFRERFGKECPSQWIYPSKL